MAPPDSNKPPPKVARAVAKNIALKGRSSPATAIKKTIAKNIEKNPLRMNKTTTPTRQRTATVPKVSTPKPKENKSVPPPSIVTKSAKKPTWKRRPKPAHSGVPVPEKMKRLLEKHQQDLDCSL